VSLRATSPAQRLDQRITFQRKVETFDSATGSVAISWALVGSCWAALDAQKASEIYRAEQIEAENLYTVVIRYRDDIDANMRIVWRGQNLDIKSIPDQQRRGRWLFLIAQQGLNDG
jgi:SPP1 family predicted phage head-tail adaptor